MEEWIEKARTELGDKYPKPVLDAAINICGWNSSPYNRDIWQVQTICEMVLTAHKEVAEAEAPAIRS